MKVDPHFSVRLVDSTRNPQQTIYAALHQCYDEGFVAEELYDEENNWASSLSSEKCGDIAVRRLLAGNRGHWGPIEDAYLVMLCGYFPHSVVVQARTHRHLSFNVQSFRYSGQRLVKLGRLLIAWLAEQFPIDNLSAIAADLYSGRADEFIVENLELINRLFYFRQAGEQYLDREGNRYLYTDRLLMEDVYDCLWDACRYAQKVDGGMAPEHARDGIGQGTRQHFLFSGSLRSFCHLRMVRHTADVQPEAQQWCELVWQQTRLFAPEICGWVDDNLQKMRLAP